MAASCGAWVPTCLSKTARLQAPFARDRKLPPAGFEQGKQSPKKTPLSVSPSSRQSGKRLVLACSISNPTSDDLVSSSSSSRSLSRRAWLNQAVAVFCSVSASGVESAFFPSLANASDEAKASASPKSETPLDAIISLFDSEETTESGKRLPKGYLKGAKEVIQNLKESLAVDPSQDSNFRKAASSAKDSIKQFLSSFRAAPSKDAEESFESIQSAIKELASFYSKQGPKAIIPESIKEKILEKLKLAESSI